LRDEALGGHIYIVLGCKPLLWDEALGGHIYAVSGCKVD